MQGGKLAPCLPDEWLRDYPETYGRPCPFIELAPQNIDAAFFLGLYLSETTRPLLTPVGLSFGFKHEWEQTRNVWRRIRLAMNDPELRSAWEEAVERSKRDEGNPDEEKLDLEEV